MLYILFSLLIISTTTAQAYTEMSLKPVYAKNSSFPNMQLGRTYNYHPGSRILASKQAGFPILDQYERLLFPQKDFSKDKAKARLERIEIAVHGNLKKGSIKHRLNLLENEISAWQIANYQTLKILESKNKDAHAYSYSNYQPTIQKRTRVRQQVNYPQYQKRNLNRKKQINYDYENYRMASPILRDIGRRSVRALFDF